MPQSSEPMADLFGPVMHTYSRAEALRDGALVDLSRWGREAGFAVPLACTRAVWERHIEWTADDARRKDGATACDREGRGWDVVWMARCAAGRLRDELTCTFRMLSHERDTRDPEPVEISLYLVLGGDDHGRPVATICLDDVADH